MITAFDSIFSALHTCCSSSSVFDKARQLAFGVLNCSGKSTLTGFITGAGKQFVDWSAFYRIFTKSRIDVNKMFEKILLKGIQLSAQSDYVIAHMDDTIIRKKGKKVVGTAWRRDPLGPPFQTNLIWGQRFIQVSLAVAEQQGLSRSRAIPIGFKHCPTPKKPNSKASEQQIVEFKEKQKQMKLNKIGAQCIKDLRQTLDNNGYENKNLIMSVDGSYTNGPVLKSLPSNVTLIGRIRKDAKFNLPASNQPKVGRKKIYGTDLPTPEQIRKSDQYKWKTVKAWAAGKVHDFQIKEVENVMWRKAGKEHRLRLIIIKPLAYRPTKNSRLLYRQPAYLICTDEHLDIQILLQAYLWRWEIEVNIGEGKSLMGVGKAHIRHKNAVESVPAFVTAVYAILHLAQLFQQNNSTDSNFMPRPKWYPKKSNQRQTTGDLLNNFKAQLYCKAIGLNFSHFVFNQNKSRCAKNSIPSPMYSHLFARAS